MKLKPGTFKFVVHDKGTNEIIKPGEHKHANKYKIDLNGNLIYCESFVNEFQLELVLDAEPAENGGRIVAELEYLLKEYGNTVTAKSAFYKGIAELVKLQGFVTNK